MKVSKGLAAGRAVNLVLAGVVALVVMGVSGAAHAGLGQPSPWGFTFQEAATEVMERINSFHNLLLWVITIITLFVLALLIYVMVRFNAKSNPTPSRTTHNVAVEIAWTVVPIVILIVIAIPSVRLLNLQLDIPKADVTIKATGKQWFWSYQYPDNGPFEFDSILARDKQPRLLAVDNEMVVPVNKTVRIIATAADVIHAFAVPSFGIKIDAIPGRINETWFKATKEGMYYGQCSELCGKDHAFMPIAVRVVSDQAFAAWIEDAKKRFASAPANTFASNDTAAAQR